MPATRCLIVILFSLIAASGPAWALDTDEQATLDSAPDAAAKPLPGFSAVQRGKGLSFHKANYLKPLTWSPDYQGDESEVEFQISLKQRFLINNLFVAYTQKSMWQAINRDNSAPFRETNYNPEIFLRLLPGDDLLRRWYLDRWGFDLGFEHESNGRPLPYSRSHNRAYLAAFRPGGDTLWYFRAWYRLPESAKSDPLDPRGDDNPTLDNYLGYGEAAYTHHFSQGHMLLARTRGNARTGKGSVELQLSRPSSDGDVFYLLSLFNGYGETLIDHDTSITRIGFGFMFNR